MTPEIFEEREEWRGPLGLSVAFHAFLFGSILLYAWYAGRAGNVWGSGYGGGSAMTVGLVNSIPLPATQAPKENVLANESKGVSQSLPTQKVQEAPDAIPIPERDRKKTKRTQMTAQNLHPQTAPEPTNVVPYGQGGPAGAIPFRVAGGSGGVGVTGAGGGDFGSRYAWYVQKVQRVISENWSRYQVSPNANASRVYITFEITRDGHPQNVQIEQSSHIPSLDYSALNALKRIDTFGPLPSDYRGNSVMVEFYFDLTR